MSNNTPGPEFFDRANALINLANDQCAATHPSEVSASTLYASARFNAFIVASTTGNAQTMASEKERALEYFTDQFRKMMVANLDDFIENYDAYMKPAAR
jgi:hypothetical protein